MSPEPGWNFSLGVTRQDGRISTQTSTQDPTVRANHFEEADRLLMEIVWCLVVGVGVDGVGEKRSSPRRPASNKDAFLCYILYYMNFYNPHYY